MSSPLWRRGEREARSCPARCLCTGAQQRLAGRSLPLSCWKIKEILFCFGTNPRAFEVLGEICWPGKSFPPLSPSISKPQRWEQSKERSAAPPGRRGAHAELLGSGHRFLQQCGDGRGWEVTVEEIPQSCVQDKPSPTLLFACCPRSASPTPELALTLLWEKLGRGGDPRISGVCLSWEQCRNERQRDPGPPRHIPEQNPRHVVSGHLWSWHSVALGPAPYLPCSSSFLEPLLYHILSIPST